MSMLSPYCIFCITRAEVELAFEQTISASVRDLRWEAIHKVASYLMPYIKENRPQKLIDAVCEKKLGFILDATTTHEIKEIMRPALPEMTYSGIVCRSRYHIPEEELMLWTHISPGCKLKPEASERCLALFEQVYGCSIHDYKGEKNDG